MKDFIRIFFLLNYFFLSDLYHINIYNEAHAITILPSVIFLLTNFVIMYEFCHRYTLFGIRSCHAWLIREITFHCTYFYFTKIWFMFMEAYKVSIDRTCEYIDNQEWAITRQSCNLIGVLLLTILSVIPLIIYTIRKCTRNRIPNFLMWIGEDPWIQSEIGISGHYLMRPPRFPARVNAATLAYRMKRSSSIPSRILKGSYVRASKSAGNLEDKKPDIQSFIE